MDEAEVLNRLAPPTDEERQALTRSSLNATELLNRQRQRAPSWLLAFRDVTSAIAIRTLIVSFLPRIGVGHKAPLVLIPPEGAVDMHLCLAANLNSLVLDYIVRQKIGGVSLSFFILKQLPVLPPSFYRPADVAYVASRVLELVYTSDDLQPLAEALRASASPLAATLSRAPYLWDDARRALLQAELDAWVARAYGLTRKQLRYILDPADLTSRELENILDPWQEVRDPLDAAGYAARAAASDFPSETFRVLKEKEQAKFGEYRTRRLVLEAWEKLQRISNE